MIQLEATGRPTRPTIAQWEMTVAVSIAATRSDVRRVENIGVDQLDVGAELVVPFLMPLLDMLAPEVGTFKEFRAVRDFAAVFGSVFLFDELMHSMLASVRSGLSCGQSTYLHQLLLNSLLNRHTSQLSDVDSFRFQQL